MTDNKRRRRRKTRTGRSSMMSIKSDQRPKCFQDIMDLVLHLSDEEWKAVTRGMTKQVSRLEFAVASSKIVTSVSSAVVRRLLKPLSKSFGIEAILEANDKLKEMSKSSKCSVPDASAQRSSGVVSDFICQLGQRIVTEIKGAMLEAIRSTASEQRVNSSEALNTGKYPVLLEDLSFACTSEICERILALCHSQELRRHGEDTTSLTSLLEFQRLMKGLEKAASVSRSSSWVSISRNSDMVSMTTEVRTPSCALSAPQSVSPFSEQFKSMASEVVSEVLLKLEHKLSDLTVISSQPSVITTNETELNVQRELAKSTAMEILQKIFCILVTCSDADQSGPEDEQKSLSFAQEIHMEIKKRVLAFICERQKAILEKRKTFVDASTEIDADLEVNTENIHTPAAVEEHLDKATQVVSDILVDRLTSRIPSSLTSIKDLSTVPSLTSFLIGTTDALSTPHTKSPSVVSSQLENISELEENVQDTEKEPLPSDQRSQFVPLHLFTVVRNHLKAFFTSFSKSAADDKGTDPSEHSEREEDSVVPISIDEEGSVHKLNVGRAVSDSALFRRNSMLGSVQFPSQLLYRFVEESVQALLQHVLNVRVDDGNDGHTLHKAEEQKKRSPRVRFVLRTTRRVVVRRPRKQRKRRKPRKRRRVPPPQVDQPSTPASTRLHEDSHRESKPSRSIFKNARKTLGRVFSNVSKTFTKIFKPSKRSRDSPE